MAEQIKTLISEEDLQNRIAELGAQITKDYEGEEIYLVSVLKGGAFITVDLAKRINRPVFLEFITASSYRGTTSTGDVKVDDDKDIDIAGKNVIIVEDIVDTGRTLSVMLEIFKKKNPKSLKLCTLLDKPDRRVTPVSVDYCGFTIPDEFVVGFGLDYDQKYRNLPYIGVVEFVD